jgi:hypothetical protein
MGFYESYENICKFIPLDKVDLATFPSFHAPTFFFLVPYPSQSSLLGNWIFSHFKFEFCHLHFDL